MLQQQISLLDSPFLFLYSRNRIKYKMRSINCFITFEGIEGCGKTTQIERLAGKMEKDGISFVRTLEPGGTSIGVSIRKMLLDTGNENLYPLTELILYEADRAQHVEEIIKPALDAGKWVICDRYFDATHSLSGFCKGSGY